MRVTAPSLRRRNVARAEVRSTNIKWLGRRHGDEDHEGEDGDHMDGEDHADHSDTSDDSSDSEDEDEEVAGTPSPPAAGGVGVITLPPVNNGAVLPGVTLGADEGEVDLDTDSDSDDEEETTTGSPPAASQTLPVGVQPPPQATITSATSGAAPTASGSSSIDQLVTASPSIEPTPLPTLSQDASLTVPAAGGAQQSGDSSVTTPERETISAAPLQEARGMDGGAAAGIVIGVLAIIGLMVGAAFIWRKYRRSRGLPVLPIAMPFGKKRDSNDPYSDGAANVNPKTNTKIMDDLMKAAYQAENGGNDMAAAYGYNEKGQSTWLDEKAFVALGGELTPRTTAKPVSRWLSGVQIPRQSHSPGFPPSERMSRQSRTGSVTRFPIRLSTSPPRNPVQTQQGPGMRPPMPGTMAGDRLDPPKPAYNARETITTTTSGTTSTSVRWYG